MSTDYQAITVVGVVLKESDLYYNVKAQGCSHDFNRLDNPFCSKCGRPAYIVENRPLKCYDPDENTLNGTEVCRVNNGQGEFVGIGLFRRGTPTQNYFESITSHRLDVIKEVVEGMLVSLGLWQEEKFGIHTLLNIY